MKPAWLAPCHASCKVGSPPMTFQYRAVLSPCIGVCNIDDDGLCAGCHRTGDEIAAWPMMNDGPA